MILGTERLTLRPVEPGDVDAFAEVFAIDDVWRYGAGRGLTRDETESWVARNVTRWGDRGFGHFAVIPRETGEIIGYCGLAVPEFLPEILPAVEIGYRIAPAWWRRGLTTEAARAVLSWAFTHTALDRIVAIYEPENVGSGRVMQKLGMRFDRETTVPGDGLLVHVYAITAEEWRASPARRD